MKTRPSPRFRPAARLPALAGGLLLVAASPAADFKRDAPGFLDRNCLACHGGEKTKADLDLKKFRSESDLLPQLKVWQSLLHQVNTGEMPPKGKPRPPATEIAAFNTAVNEAIARAEAKTRPDPGQVTIRRLNRAEYNHTVRDLLGVDFDPAADFPADDIGHGFDNIGDVLTVSPVLLERYLAAADAIAQRAVVLETPKPPVRHLSGRYLQPNNSKTPQGRFRLLDPDATDPTLSGPFTAAADYLKFSARDELIFRATVYAETKGTAPVKVALFVQGRDLSNPSSDAEVARLLGTGVDKLKPLKILGTFEITARNSSKAQTIEVPVNRRGDLNRAGIAVLKPPAGQPTPKLHIEHLWSKGPLETRPEAQLKLLAIGAGKPAPEQAREIVNWLLLRAFRRPPTAPEIERYLRAFEEARRAGGKLEHGLQQLIRLVLCSPKFLFRVELDHRPIGSDARPVDEHQLASRLSYFLWSSLPDDELFGLAARGRLTANLEAQVKRMLKDARSRSLVDRFGLQWLQLERLATFAPDRKMFGSFDPELRRAMRQETELFLGEIIQTDRSILDLVDGRYTFLNETLARHYGIGDTAGNPRSGKKSRPNGQPIPRREFVRVELPNPERGGLLSHASILTVTSNPTRTSPVKRGKWVLEQLLGTPPPPPPAAVPELEEQAELKGTLRQRMEQHRANPNCANCHQQMDAIGFAFENYDAIGRWRTRDAEGDIDPSGTLPDGRSFQGPAELKAVLKARPELITRNLAEKLLTYALGRGLEYYDGRAVRQIVEQTAKQDHRFSALVTAIVRSDPFRLRRGREMSQQAEAK